MNDSDRYCSVWPLLAVAGNGCPVRVPRSCPAGWAGFGSPCPWPVAVSGIHLSVIGRGLVGSSHDAILWSRACHTFPSPRLVALGASADHGGGCLVSGDVLIGGAPVLVSPRAAVGGVDRVQAEAVSAGLCGEPVAEHGGRDTGYGLAEAFAALASAHGFPPNGAGGGEVEVFHRDGVETVARGVADEPVIACRTWASRRADAPDRSRSIRAGGPTGLPCSSRRRTARCPSLRSTPTTGPSARTSSLEFCVQMASEVVGGHAQAAVR
jgi:hypothetical protein